MALTDAQIKAIQDGFIVEEAGKPGSIQRFFDTYNGYDVVGIKLVHQRMLVLLRGDDEIYPHIIHMQAHRFRYICEYQHSNPKETSDLQLVADLQNLVDVGHQAAAADTFL